MVKYYMTEQQLGKLRGFISIVSKENAERILDEIEKQVVEDD